MLSVAQKLKNEIKKQDKNTWKFPVLKLYMQESWVWFPGALIPQHYRYENKQTNKHICLKTIWKTKESSRNWHGAETDTKAEPSKEVQTTGRTLESQRNPRDVRTNFNTILENVMSAKDLDQTLSFLRERENTN